ncbi:hypothetical protein PtrSN002B_012457, partial [Pyrenophora tritici-repentis]
CYEGIPKLCARWAEVGPKCPAADVSTDTHDPTASELKITPKNLEAYIKVRFDSRENCAKYAESFASALGGVYSLCEPPEDVVWKYDNQDGTGTVIPP